MILQTWGDVVVVSLQDAWSVVVAYVPFLLSAIIVFVILWIVAVALGKLVEQVIRALKVDDLLRKLDVEKALERGGVHLNTGAFIGGLVRWFLIIVALHAAANILGLNEVTNFLADVLRYLPNVVVAAVILIIAALVADTSERVARASVDASGLHGGAMAGVVTRWAVWLFAIVAALQQLDVASALLTTVSTGIVAMLALALGLAFGLGGKDAASGIIDRAMRDIKG